MKTFLKFVLCVLLVILAIKFLPVLLFPFVVGGLGLTLILALAFAAVATVAGVGVTAVVAIAGVLLALVAVLSPIWIPVLAIIGVIALIRRSNRAPVVAG